MFDRTHHQRIAKIPRALNSDLLLEAECYFAGAVEKAAHMDEDLVDCLPKILKDQLRLLPGIAR